MNKTMDCRIRLCLFPSVGLAFCVACCSSAFAETGAAPSVTPDDTTTVVVRLEPVAVAGFDAVLDDVQTLSGGTKVFLKKMVDGDLRTGLLILVDSNGTRRLIMTKGFVLRMRCAGDKIYTQEIVESLSRMQRNAEILRAAKAAGEDWDLAWETWQGKVKRSHEIRQYDPAPGTSRTLVAPDDRSHLWDFLAREDGVYLFELSKANRRDIHITRLSLSGDSKETSTVTLAAPGARPLTGQRGPYSFLLRSGWLYYLTRSAVCRVNLATDERRTLVEDPSVYSFCITQEPEALLYLKEMSAPNRRGRTYVLRVVPLDGAFPGPTELAVDAVIARLDYDETEKAAMLFVEIGATLAKGLYRVDIAH